MILDIPLEVLFLVLDFTMREPSETVVVSMTSKKWYDILAEWRKARGYPEGNTIVLRPEHFAKTVELIRWARRGKLTTGLSPDWFRGAIKYGNIEALNFLQANKCYWNSDAFSLASTHGHVEVLEWLLKITGQVMKPQDCAKFAAIAGHVEVLGWLKSKGCSINYAWPTAYAAQNGKFEVVKWLALNQDIRVCLIAEFAALGGHLEILKWLKEHNFPRNTMIYSRAALSGHLDVLIWLRQEGYPWDEWSCSAAAHAGQLVALKWLRENGCPWDKDTCRQWAVSNQQPEVVAWIDTQ